MHPLSISNSTRWGFRKFAKNQAQRLEYDEEEYKYVSVTSILCQSTTCVSYLLEKMSQKNLEGWDTALRLHAAEILATIVQHDDARLHLDNLSQLKSYNSILVEDEEEANGNKKQKASIRPTEIDGIECFLQAISMYRKKRS